MRTKRAPRPSRAKPVAPKPDEGGDTKPKKTPKEPKGPNRHEQLEAMLRSEGGTSVEEMQRAFGILPHTARAMLSILRNKRGLPIERDAAGRYTIVTAN